MQDFAGKIAVVTGGAGGMGRHLVLQLAAAGCHVATCDLSELELEETRELALAAGTDVHISTHACDVSDEDAILAFREKALAEHETSHINLLFNNAGISGGGSLFEASREAWDRTFAVCWGGVYYGTRAFLPDLVASEEGHIINTSSVNGFWATMGPERSHTAYSAAKFAVKGFTEALITDLRIHAPHVGVSVVMPGHIGTGIVINSMKYGIDEVPADMAPFMNEAGRMFEENAPMTSAEAATVILDGVKDGRWRILVGDDAHALDAAVRANPEGAYEGDHYISVMSEAGAAIPPPAEQ